MAQLQQEFDYTFKIALTGNSSVGKSSLMMRFTEDAFNQTNLSTIGVDFKMRSFEVDNKLIRLNIWDTAGQERFDSIINAYYRGIHACLIVFDITDRQSFTDVEKWFAKYKKNSRSEAISILIGNKSDLESHRAISYEEATELANEYGMKYIETSAKTKENVDKCFLDLSKTLIKNIQLYRNPPPINIIGKPLLKAGSEIKSSTKKGSCC